MTKEKAEATVNEIFRLYELYGSDDYIGEPVSQIEHMCQAAQLAEIETDDEEIILAAFFHDIGHLCEDVPEVQSMDGYGVIDHESSGSRYLSEKGFSEKITRLVESHVRTKRYLTYKYPEYLNKLSYASKITLIKQGGSMNETEAQEFEMDSLHLLFIKIREWDDRAKLKHVPLPSLDIYKQMALRHLINQH